MMIEGAPRNSQRIFVTLRQFQKRLTCQLNIEAMVD